MTDELPPYSGQAAQPTCQTCGDSCSAAQLFCSIACTIEGEFRGIEPPAFPSDIPIPYAPAVPADLAGFLAPIGVAARDTKAGEPVCIATHGCAFGSIRIGPDPETTAYVLPTDSEDRKDIPIFSGVLNYFPLAIAAVARVSKRGNDKHNPGEPLHWARGKSMDHRDCIARHLIDVDTLSPASAEYEDAAALAWRALALLQELEEKRLGKPMSRGSKESK